MISEEKQLESIAIFNTAKNKRVIDLLKKQGKHVIEFPQILVRKIELKDSDFEVLNKLRSFEWLIFADIFAVEYFLENLEQTGFELFELDDFRICACGEAVADRLRFAQIHADVIPPQISAEIVFASINEYIHEAEQMLNSAFLVIKTRNKNLGISDYFNEKKVKNFELNVCEIEKNDDLIGARLKTLISGGAIDKFIFTSPEDIESFLALTENAADILISEIKIEATDELTAQAFRELGIQI